MAEKHNTTDNRRKLYDVLQQHVGNMGTWDEFNRRMDDEGNRRKVYEVAQQRVANIGSWDEFNARIYQAPAPATPKQEPQNAATPAVEPQAAAATPAQPRWQPTEQDKIRMQWEMFQSMNGFKQRTKARLDQTRRMAERFTPEGRRKLKAAKFAAQAAGAPTKVMGITPPAQAPAGAQAGGQAGAPPVQSGESPVPYGVKYIDGKPVTEWLLPDGSLTTSLLEADQAEFGARKARLRHQFEKRMKSNGLNPANPDDVELQAQYDAQAPAFDVVADLWSEAEELHKKDRERNADRAWDSYAAMGGGRELRVVTASMNRHADNISHLTRFDLQKMMDKAWERVGPQIYANCYSRLKQQYPGASAQDLHKTATEMARSLSDNAVYQYAVDKNTPKSTMEFFGRTVADMNLINSLGKALARSQAGTSGDMAAYDAATAEYAKHHRVAQVGGTVVGMAIDPVTWISGGVGSAAGKGALWTGGRIMARFTGTTGQVATRYLGTTLTGRLLGGMAGAAANLGTYEALKEGERQLKYGGYINPETGKNEGYSPEAIWKQAKHGAGMGVLIGWVGPVAGNVFDPMVKSASSIGGKIALRGGEQASSALFEGTIFAAPDYISMRSMSDEDFDKQYAREYGYASLTDPVAKAKARSAARSSVGWDIWNDSMAMMLGFKAQHGIKSAWRTVRDMAPYDPEKLGRPLSMQEKAHNRQSFQENLRKALDKSPADIAMSKEELEELRNAGYGKLASLFHKNDYSVKEVGPDGQERVVGEAEQVEIQYGPDEETVEGVKKSDFDGYDTMARLMQDSNVSEAVRAKAYFILTGRRLPESTIMSYRIVEGENDGVYVQSLSGQGSVVTNRHFSSRAKAQQEITNLDRQIELNSIEIGEKFKAKEILSNATQAGCEDVAAAHGEGWTAEGVRKAYEQAEKDLADPEKAQSVGQATKDLLKEVEAAANKHVDDFKGDTPDAIRERINYISGVDLDEVIRKERSKRTDKEQAALEAYLKALYPEEARQGETVDGEAPEEPAPSQGQATVQEAREAGYNMTDQGQREQAMRNIRYQEKRMEEMFGRTDTDAMFEEELGTSDPAEILDFLDQSRYDATERAAIVDYLKACQVGDAAVERMEDDARNAMERENAFIDKVSHEDGFVRPATMKVDSRQVYIVGGNVVLSDDGSLINTAASDRVIYIYDPATDKVEQTAPEMLSSLGTATSVEETRAAAERSITEQHENDVRTIQGDIMAFNPGDTFVADVFGDGPKQNRVTGIDENGMIIFESEGRDGVFGLMPDQLSAMVDSYKQEAFEAEMRQQAEAAPVVDERAIVRPGEAPAESGAEPAPAEPAPLAPVSIKYDQGDSFRVAVSGREETQQAAVVDREGETVTIWTPFPVTDSSEKGRTMSGYTTDISRTDLDVIVARDEQGKPLDYVVANPEAEPSETSAGPEEAVIREGITGTADALKESFTVERERIGNEWLDTPAVQDAMRTYADGASTVEEIVERAKADSNDERTRQRLDTLLEFDSTRQKLQAMLDVPKTGETVPTSAEIPQNPTESPVSGAETVLTGQEAQAAAVEPMREVKEKGETWEEPDYLATTPQRTHSYIYNESGLSRQEANDHVNHMARTAKEAVDKHKKSAPKIGGSIARYQKEKTEWENAGVELQRAVEFWDEVKAEQKKVTDAERAALEAQQAQAHDEAVARFEQDQIIKAQKKAEQDAIGTNAVNPKLKAKWDAAPKIVGNANAHVLADGSNITGHYVLTEAGAASASHDPNNAFAPTEGFPIDENGQNVNDRDYERDKDAQRMVENMGAAFDSRALQTPVIVSQDGIVLSGNNRTMSGDLAAAQGTDKAYVDHLTQYGSMYGFTLEQVASMKHPRVVFVPDEALPYDSTTFSRFNAQEMKSQSKPEAAVKLGKIVPDAVFNSIVGDINRYERMSDFYANESAAASALGALHAAGVINDAQMPELRTGTALSAAGKELLENTLIGKVFQSDPDAVRKIMEIPSMRQVIVMALAEVANNRALAGKGFDIVDELSKAVDLCYRAKSAHPDVFVPGIPVSPFGRQQGLFDDEFGESRVTDATTLLLADLLNDTRPSRLRNVLTIYNKEAGNSAAGSMDLFTGEIPSKETILTEINNHFINATPKEQQAIVDAAIAERRAAAEEAAAVTTTEGSGEGSQRPEQAPDPVQRSEGDGGTGGNTRTSGRLGREASSNLPEKESGLICELSSELNEYGKPFVKSSDGSIEFGYIDEESGLEPLPIRLSLGENRKDENGDDHGYGYLHIEAGHKNEILQNGFSSVEEFVESVARNYTDIKEGAKIGENQTYLLEVSDVHNNTLFIQLSRDGKYWNVNSAGIFKKRYSRRKPEVYSRPAVGDGKGTDTTEVNSGQTKGATAPAGNSSVTSDGKVNNSTSEKQGEDAKSSEAEALGANNLPVKERMASMTYEEVEQIYADYDAAIEERYDAMIEPLESEKAILENKRRTPAEGKRLKAIDKEIADIERQQEEERLKVGKYFSEELRSRWKNGEHSMTRQELEQDFFIDEAEAMKAETAAKIAAAESEVNTEPTEAQKKAGNYKMGHVEIDGLKISIENPKGSMRRGKEPDGTPWENEMKNTYGYIKDTTGVDGDKIDVFLSDNPTDGDVYVVDQYNKDGSFDEHKVMYGFTSATEAEAAYLSNYSADWAKGRKVVVTGVTREEFKKWLDANDRKKKPFAEYKSVKPIETQDTPIQAEALAEPAEATEGYDLDVYETKKGKKFHRVKFPRADKEVWKERLDIAKEQFGGTSVPGGYGFKDAETAKAFAEAILHPVSAEALKKKTNALEAERKTEEDNPVREKKEKPEAKGWDLNPTSILTTTGDGAKLQISKQMAKANLHFVSLDFAGVKKPKGFIAALSKALGTPDGTHSQSFYYEVMTEQGDAITLRLSNHNANAANHDGKTPEISIVVKSRRQPNRFYPTDHADVTEYVYFKEDIAEAGGNTLSQIAKDISAMLDTGEYADTSGLARVNRSPEVSHDDKPTATPEPEQAQPGPETEAETQQKDAEQKARSKWFNEEDQDEAAELIRKMKARLRGGNLYSGVPIDVELLECGCRLGYLIMKKGARKLHEYAQAMIENLGDGIRPYIKQFYNATLATEEALAGEWYKDATPMPEIAKFDMANFLKEGPKDIVETAKAVAEEQEVKAAMPKAATDMVKKSRDKMAIPGYFKPDGSVSAETKAAQAGADLAAALVDELGLDLKNLPEGVQVITTDFNESGGNIRINLPIRAGYEPIKVDIDFDKTEEGALRLRELTTTMKRGDDLSYIIGEDHQAWLVAPGHKELLNAIRGQIKDYLPKATAEAKPETKKPAPQPSLFDEPEAPTAPATPEPHAKTGDKLLMQYEAMKKKHPDAVVLFRVGDFYETFHDDARIISETLGLTLTTRGGDKIPLAGFPHHALDAYLPKLVRAGKRVAICEQLEEPKISKQTVKRGTTPQPATEPKAPATSQAEFDELAKNEFEVDPQVDKEIIADRNGFKIGDTVEWSIPGQGKTSATIIDVDRDGRPILDTGMAPIISSIAEWKDLTRKNGEGSQPPAPQRPKSELSGDSAKEQDLRNVEHDFVEAVSNELIQRINNDGSPLTMAEVRKMAEERGMKDVTPTDLQELVERSVSLRARSIAEHTLTGGPGTQEIGFNKIVKLYTTQPVLSDRDVERIQRQQYSTPVPMGYLMDQFMMSHGHKGKRLLEPSAGNGALTIGVPKENCHVNDIDPRRLANLRAMGFKVITNQDALQPFNGQYDMVVTNPPFGTAPAPRTYDGLFEITTLEGQMAINALESMTDDGRAAIIVGGSIGKWPTPYEKNGRLQKVADRQFFGYLYSHYNVVDIIPIDGKSLYSRNGTGYNVRMILIDGRRRDAEGNVIREVNAENRVFPPVKEEARPEAVTTYDELYKRVQDDILRIQQRLDVAPRNDGGHIEGDGAVNPSDAPMANPAGDRGGERPVGTGNSSRTPRSGLGGTASGGTSSQGGIYGRSGRNRGTIGQTDADAGSGDGSTLDERPGAGGRQTELRAVEHVDRSGDRGGIRHGATDADGGSRGNNADGARQRSGSGSVRLNQPKPVKVELTDEKVASPHVSSSANLMSRMPAAQAQEFERALHELEEKHGNVDEWLTQELGYADTADLYRALAAEQVEGVAMAIDKMNSGRGFIIADQTGIGKGRQAAPIIRYAVRNGHKPIFFTQKAGLFSDMYRDLKDIGCPDLKPFIFGSDKDEASITERQDDGTDKVIYPLPKPKERDRVLSYIEKHGTLPDEYDYAVITYSQVQNGTTQYEIGDNGKIEAKPKTKKGKGASSGEINGERRRHVIDLLSRGNYLILDEAHTAGGQSGLGGYMQSIIPGVKGITYLSATYAKRPDNMPLYAIKTAISDSGVEVAELISAVAQGGVPLQEIMSRQLVKSGEMARRERDFTGVTIDWIPTNEGVAREQQKRFDTVSEIFVDIMRFQDTYVRPYLNDMSKDLARIGSSSGQKKGTKDMGIGNAPFASKLYNLLQQLLFSIKVDAVADRAIKNLQNGRKPIISFVNTMEGFLEEASAGMTEDGSASMPTLSLALRKALDGVMRYTVKDDNNKETHSALTASQIGPDAETAYNAIIEKMNAVSDDLPIAPLDAIRLKIEAAGYKVGELSGRKLELAKNDKGLYVIRNRKAADKKATAADFNAGKIDVLMVNKTGSTGISLHASSKFEDQRQRVMIAAQFQPDVNDEVQMRGRNDRTGQVVRGAYEYLLSSIPAEQRLQMMFKAKLKSLDANTTSSQKSSFNEMEVVDVLNKYGDAIVRDYLNEDPMGLNMDMGNPLEIDPNTDVETQQKAAKKSRNNDDDDGTHSGFARKALGRLALLSIAEQERVMSEITDRYEKKIHELDERGENDLEISYRDLKAKTLGRKVWVEGKAPGSGNAFADNVYMEQVEVNILDKPLSGTELAKYHRTFLEDAGVETWDEWLEKKTAEIDAFYENRIATVRERITANKEATIARRIERFIATAKDARALGKNSFTDEEITAEANRRYGETERQEAKAEIERETEKIRIQQNLIKRRLTQFKPMSPLSIPDDLTDESKMNLEPSTGVMVGIKIDSKYSLNGSQVVFAPLDGRRTITLSLKEAGVAFSKIGQASMMMRDVLRNFDLSQWDSHISNESRETRYMLTGNILRALVDMQKTQNARGRITAYTTEDGEVRTGILMSPKFTPGDLQSSAPLSSMLSKIQAGQEVKSSNGEVTVRKTQSWSSRGDYEILVPKSKKHGGKYFLPEQDPVLARYVVGGFEMPRSGSQAIGYIRAENLARVLDHLSTKHGASVMLSSKLKDATQNNIEYRTPEEGIEYVNARAIQPWSAPLDHLRFKRGEMGYSLSLSERQQVRDLGAQEKAWEEKWAAEHTDTDVPTGRRSRFEFYADQYGQGGLSSELYHAKREIGSLYDSNYRLISANARDMARRAIPAIMRRRADLLAERPSFSRAGQAAIDAELADLEYMALYYQRMEAGEDVEHTMPGRLEHQRMLATAREVAESLGEKVVLYEAPGDIHDTDYNRQVRKQRSYGWYNPNDGTIHINVGRHKNVREIVKTALHEIIGHKTIEQIMGPKRFARLIDEIWNHAGRKVRAKIAEKMGKNGWDFREATKEYLGEIAEEVHTKGYETLEAEKKTIWQRVKAKIQDFLNRILEGLKIPARIRLTENDLSYMMWKLYKHKERKAAGKPAEGDIFDKAEEIVRRERWERDGNSMEIAARYGEADETSAENLAHGVDSLRRIALGEEEVKDAMHRNDLAQFSASTGITFVFGKPGDSTRNYKGGYGLAHIGAKHGADTILKVLDAIAYGKISRYVEGNKTVIIEKDGYEALLALTRYGNKETWLFNGWDKIETTGENGKVSANTVSTQANPTFSREDLGAVVDDAKIREFFESAKKYPDYVKDLLPSDIENANTEYRVFESGRTYDPEAGLHFRDGDDMQNMTIEERTLKLSVMLADRHSGDVAVRDAAVEALGKTLGNIRKAMAVQHTYDFNTVRSLGAVADILISSGTFLPEGPGEVKRLYGIMKRGIGHTYTDDAGVEHVTQSEKDYNTAVESLMDLFVSNQLKLSDKFLDEVMKIRGSKVNARGVEVIGDLDVEGQIMVRGMKDYMKMDVQAIHDRIDTLDDIIANGNDAASMNAAAEKMGLELAEQYVAEVSDRVAQEKVMRDQLRDMTSQWDPSISGDARKAYTEQKRALRESIRKISIERADAMRQLASQIGNELRNSIERVKAYREREKQRIEEIWHNANSDMTGRPFDEHGMKKKGPGVKLSNNLLSRVLLAPAATFEQVMRVFGSKSVDGEGYLFDRYVRGWQECREREWTSTQEVEGILDKKAAEILGKRKARWSDLYALTNKAAGSCEWWDGGQIREHKVTQGNLMYMYMVNKMTDGQVKLRRMCITDDKMLEIERALDPRLKAVADWLQEELLPNLRNKYNEVHMRMFGAPMAEIENYFPLRILANARLEEVEMAGKIDGKGLPKTMTGAIIKRRFNNYALDVLNSDAVSVALDHIREMETWAAFAEYRRDLCTLLSYKHFRNQVKNMSTIYGSGEKFWDKFYDLALLVGGAYRPKDVNDTERALVNLTKLATGACIAIRLNTALKQLLSYPAFAPDANLARLMYNVTPWRARACWKWAIKNMPSFQRRWKSRQAGNDVLRPWKFDWDWTRTDFVQKIQRIGITPNAFIDALTVAMGSEAVYQNKLKGYLKDGFSKEEAHRRAIQDAEIIFNLSQQSSELPYLSILQNKRSYITTSLTNFRSSPMSYLRQSIQSKRELANMVKSKDIQIEFEMKKGVREGLTPEQAKARAERKFKHNWVRNLFKSATFDYILPALWTFGITGIWYCIFGNDDEKKKQYAEDAIKRGLFGGFEGFTFGGSLPDFVYGLANGDKPQLKEETSPGAGLLFETLNLFSNGKTERAANEMINTMIALGVGVNPQVLEDGIVAGIDFFGEDEKSARDWALLFMRVLSCPQSQMDQVYFDELGMDAREASRKSPAELAERYATYKARRANFATMWTYDDNRWEAEVKAPWRKKFEKEAKTRLEGQSDEHVNESLEGYDAEWSQTGKRLRELSSTPGDAVTRAAKAQEIFNSPEGTRYKLYNDMHPYLDQMIKSWLSAPTAQEAATEAAAIIEYKAKLVEMLDAWDNPEKSRAAGREAMSVVKDWHNRQNPKK